VQLVGDHNGVVKVGNPDTYPSPGAARSGGMPPDAARGRRRSAVGRGWTPVSDEPLPQLRRICLGLPETRECLSHGHSAFFVRAQRPFVTYQHLDDRLALWRGPARLPLHAGRGRAPSAAAFAPYVGSVAGLACVSIAAWTRIATIVAGAYRAVAPRGLVARSILTLQLITGRHSTLISPSSDLRSHSMEGSMDRTDIETAHGPVIYRLQRLFLTVCVVLGPVAILVAALANPPYYGIGPGEAAAIARTRPAAT
jgi:hypothetical protein